jgi:uncharacterized membrane protein
MDGLTAMWIVIYVLVPVLVIYLCQRYPILDKISAVMLCYAVGIVAGNMGFLSGGHVNIVPQGFSGVQEYFFVITIALALPLIFFSIDIRRWFGVAGKAVLSFGLEIVAVVIAAATGYLIFRDMVGGETWKVAGMLIGVYTGGTVNLGAIGTALDTDKTVLAATQISDVVVSLVYLLLVLTVLQHILLKFLPAFKRAAADGSEEEIQDYNSYAGFFNRGHLLPLAGALALSIAILAVGVGLTFIFPKDTALVVAVLAVSTLGIAFSFVPRIRKIPMTYQLGQYFILIFCLVVSSMSDLSRLFGTTLPLLAMVGWAVFISLGIHIFLAWIFKIDADTVIITSVAGIYSPPFVPMVARVLKNKDIVVSGVVTGIIGWVVGTYLGIAVAYILRGL